MKAKTIENLKTAMYGMLLFCIFVAGGSEEPYKMGAMTTAEWLTGLTKLCIIPILIAVVIKIVLLIDEERKYKARMELFRQRQQERRAAERRADIIRNYLTTELQYQTENNTEVELEIPEFMKRGGN